MPTLEIISGKSTPLTAYRATASRINDLVNTRLDVRFDFEKCYLYGKAWITLKPHFYPTDSLTLDAKGMVIHEVALWNGKSKHPLHYRYDSLQLHIDLEKTYTRADQYTVFIDYTSRPNAYEAENPGGSSAITSNKGLYFINPDGSNPYMPTEVWTQGESESNSVWFPTIDKPDQKTMEEISMTVPERFTTLSNGQLITQKTHGDGTRTDTWKMIHPNAPYLFMMAVGPFVIVKDHWKNIPVNYYVEKKYAPYAREIFGKTPQMIDFYSRITGIPYAWTKYDQVVARDYVSGAMENTTATLHGEFLYQTHHQMQDDDYQNESVIAHELFHHWFGDLVTCESWSNLTLNESFADFSEMLWAEHAYGKDLADQHSYQAMQEYFSYAASGKDHPLVDFYYRDREDVFDNVTYQKGGRILNMLRNYVGDSAFFHALHLYLKSHMYGNAEAQDLRLAFEQVTGKDLNWFWNQWYYGQGYPHLDISYQYNDALHLAQVIVHQSQTDRVFQLPFAIDVYAGGKKERHQVMMRARTDTFTFHYTVKPDLINVDGDKVLLATRKDHKTLHNYLYQYHHAGLYLDRREAIEACGEAQDSSEEARQLLQEALHDRFSGIRSLAIKALDLDNPQIRKATTPILLKLIRSDDHSSVRDDALSALAGSDPAQYKSLLMETLRDSSYRLQATSLGLLSQFDPTTAYSQAKALETQAEDPLSAVVCEVLARKLQPEDFPYIKENFEGRGGTQKFSYLHAYLYMLSYAITDSTQVISGLHEVEKFAKSIGPSYGVYVLGMLNNFSQEKRNAANLSRDEATKSQLNRQADYAQALIRELQGVLTP